MPNAPDAPAAALTAPDAIGAPTIDAARAPWRLGLGIVAVLTAAFLAAQAAQGRRPFGLDGSAKDVRVALLHVAMAGLFPAAVLSLRERARRTQQALDVAEPLAPSSRTLLVAALAGVAGSLFGPYLMEPDVAGPLAWWNPARWTPETAWHRVLGFWAGAWSLALIVAIVVVARRLSRLAPHVGVDELLDPAPLAPYVQLSLHMALLALAQLSIYGAFAIDFGAARQILVNVGIGVALLTTALVLPLRGVRARAAAVKRDELAWCDGELRRARHALRAGGDGTGRAGLLADLVAYRAVVERASDWAFDVPALRRLALYLLLPLGSWIASSLVQHVLERYVLRG